MVLDLKKFVSYSLIIHALSIYIFFTLNIVGGEKGVPFFVRLVAQDETGMNSFLDSEEDIIGQNIDESFLYELPYVPQETTPDSNKLEQQSFDATSNSREVQEKENSKRVPLDNAIIQPGTGFAFGARMENNFNRDIFEKYLKEGTEQYDGSIITLDTKEFKYYSYMKDIKDRIEKIWQYPLDAALRGITGDIIIRFAINKNGKLNDIELLKTSGHSSLDEAVIKTLQVASPYSSFPIDWNKDSLIITGHFIYTRSGMYMQ